jgi:hypothetical protein
VGVTGWFGDFFRFWPALFYWNIRKAWFRLCGAARDDCPCQNASDSGLAGETRCDAITHWHQPRRFRRICPLLTETPDGWRCAVEAERVRPFWGRAAGYVAATMLLLYFLATIAAYLFLRSAQYEISYLTVAWPPRWGDIRRAQEGLHAQRAQQALDAGNYRAAMLSLEMVSRLNPGNYSAGLTLARLSTAAAEPDVADHIYQRLMHDVPEQRRQTAQIWYVSLLSRGAFAKILPLAAAMLGEDPAQRGAWLYALLFAARQTQAGAYLGTVQEENPHLPEWCTELIAAEQALLNKQPARALPLLTRVQRQPPTPLLPYYQVDRLILNGSFDQASRILAAYAGALPADEASFLRLRIGRATGQVSLLPLEYANLLQLPLSVGLAHKFCAYLITQPTPELLGPFVDRLLREGPPLVAATLPLYQAAYLAAALANDSVRQEAIGRKITAFTASDQRALRGLAEIMRTGKPDPRITRILPLVQLPTEVLYGILQSQVPAAPK